MSDGTYTYYDDDTAVELALLRKEVMPGHHRVILTLHDLSIGGERLTVWLTLDDARRMADAIEDGTSFEFVDPSDDVVSVVHGTLQTRISVVCRSLLPDGEEPSRLSVRLAGVDVVLLLAELRTLSGRRVAPPANHALDKARVAVADMLGELTGNRRPKWRVIITDSESPTGIAPVCTAERSNALHTIPDFPGGPKRDDEGVYDCCPWPQIETCSTATAAYLVELLNADTEGGAA